MNLKSIQHFKLQDQRDHQAGLTHRPKVMDNLKKYNEIKWNTSEEIKDYIFPNYGSMLDNYILSINPLQAPPMNHSIIYTTLRSQLARTSPQHLSSLTLTLHSTHLPNEEWNNVTSDPYSSDLIGQGVSHDPVFTVFKIVSMLIVIVSAIIGNTLVIVSVLKYERLRIIANSFIVSMAMADLLVASLVMTFSASQEGLGYWRFGELVCDLFNANDVLFSTASLQHLCCISVDRYIAVTDPFHYESRMTRVRVGVMLSCVWAASALISHAPIHAGWYRTANRNSSVVIVNEMPECQFEVNQTYGVISSTISFWLPVFVMVTMYVKIFREARRQERMILELTQDPLVNDQRVSCANHSPMPQRKINNRTSRSNGDSATASNQHLNGVQDENTKLVHEGGRNRNSLSTPVRAPGRGVDIDSHAPSRVDHLASSQRRLAHHRKKLQRENKAARTLGIIMGAFLFCWLPFFTWYLSTSFCQSCHTPPILISILFWIGYLNSALNPLIYAFFNRDFREAFKRLLKIKQLKSLLGWSTNDFVYDAGESKRCCCRLLQLGSSSGERSPVSVSRRETSIGRGSGRQSPVEMCSQMVRIKPPRERKRCCSCWGSTSRTSSVRRDTVEMADMHYIPMVPL